jgi:hypothetical protein
MAGSMDVAMNTHAVMLEKRYQRHNAISNSLLPWRIKFGEMPCDR